MGKITYDCKMCGISVAKYQIETMTHSFCSMDCKSEWQRQQKPVTKEWLYQKYVVEEMDCTQIGKIINRNPKTVWGWLKGFDIPTRSRGHILPPVMKGKNHPLYGVGHTDETKEKIRQVRLKDGHVPYLKDGIHWLRHEGAVSPNYKGGISPERQEFYGSDEWKGVARLIWTRDNATRQRCNKKYHNGLKTFHIHHIVSFMVKELRADLDNLILLCRPCHLWVHSRKNTDKLFIKEMGYVTSN